MSISAVYENVRGIALTEFADVVVHGDLLRLPSGEPVKLRLYLSDSSFIDVNLSATGRYAYHGERRLIGRAHIYRFDNAPHERWRGLATYPAHFHNGMDDNTEPSNVSAEPTEAIRQVISFVRSTLRAESAGGAAGG